MIQIPSANREPEDRTDLAAGLKADPAAMRFDHGPKD